MQRFSTLAGALAASAGLALVFAGQAMATPAPVPVQEKPLPAVASDSARDVDDSSSVSLSDPAANRPPSAFDPITGRPVIYLSSPTPADQAYTLKPGDTAVINSPPVPDTPENRAKYGQPMSRAGKLTTPAGN